LTSERDRRHDISSPGATGDDCRAAIDQAVADLPHLVVGRRTGPDEFATKAGLQLVDSLINEDRGQPRTPFDAVFPSRLCATGAEVLALGRRQPPRPEGR